MAFHENAIDVNNIFLLSEALRYLKTVFVMPTVWSSTYGVPVQHRRIRADGVGFLCLFFFRAPVRITFIPVPLQMLVLLGEVGGADEYDVCDALKSGRITKPVVAWCIGTCASIFPFEVRS